MLHMIPSVILDTHGHTVDTESSRDNVGKCEGISDLDCGGVLKSNTLVPNVQHSRNVSHVHNRFNHVYANTLVHGDVDNVSASSLDTIEHDLTVPVSHHVCHTLPLQDRASTRLPSRADVFFSKRS